LARHPLTSESAIAGRRVLVTGGHGFLGREVCRRVEAAGAAAVVVPTHAEYELTERDAVRRLLVAARPELVIHLAAEVGGIGANRENPGRYFYANLAMGLHLIEEARLAGVEKFVQLGTVCSYPKLSSLPFTEDSLWDGYPDETNAPYGIAKKALLVMLQAYRDQYGFHGIYLMPANLYGPGDNFDPSSSHVIPALIARCEDARRGELGQITCWGSGSASREFLYVEDCAAAVVAASERYEGAEPVNLGSGNEITIRDLAAQIAVATGFTGEICWNPAEPDGQPRRRLDISRAQAAFGFTASTPLADGLRATVAWFRRTQIGESSRGGG
jgi:GDP-L-fucose synthase